MSHDIVLCFFVFFFESFKQHSKCFSLLSNQRLQNINKKQTGKDKKRNNNGTKTSLEKIPISLKIKIKHILILVFTKENAKGQNTVMKSFVLLIIKFFFIKEMQNVTLLFFLRIAYRKTGVIYLFGKILWRQYSVWKGFRYKIYFLLFY